MSELLIYLFKVNVALLLFYLVYYLVLRRLTFYSLNRLFLVFAIAFSTVYPFIEVSALLSGHQELNKKLIIVNPNWKGVNVLPEPSALFDLWQLLQVLFWGGVIFMAFRMGLQLLSLYRIHNLSYPDSYQHIFFRRVKEKINPFSFWRSIYLNPDQHKEPELLSILRHEQVHVKNWHTLDVLVAELSTVFYWFNPGAWLIKQAIKQNLEFITDDQVLKTGLDSKLYQYSLIQISNLAQGTPLANNFNFLTIKNRIAMMNKMPSTKAHQLKFLLVIPLIAGLIFTFNGVAQDAANKKEVLPTPPTSSPSALPTSTPSFDDFMKRNPQIKFIAWEKANLIIGLKSGKTETYDLENNQSLNLAEKKYGFLPSPPPPPPAPAAPPVPPAPPAIEASAPNSETAPANQSKIQNKPENINTPEKVEVKIMGTNPGGEPVYYLNGKKIDQTRVSAIDPQTISRIDVLKGKSAVEKYGQEAAFGAVQITLKGERNIANEAANPESFNMQEVQIKGSVKKIRITEDPKQEETLVIEEKPTEVLIPEKTIADLSRNEKKQLVLQELKSDGLYSNDKLYTFRITNSAMYINNKKQAENLFRKYRKYLPYPDKNVPWQIFEVKGRFREE